MGKMLLQRRCMEAGFTTYKKRHVLQKACKTASLAAVAAWPLHRLQAGILPNRSGLSNRAGSSPVVGIRDHAVAVEHARDVLLGPVAAGLLG